MDDSTGESNYDCEQERASDAAIITSILAGHRDDYALLVRRYCPLVEQFWMAHGLTGADLDDGVQAAFVVTYGRLHRLRNRNGFGSYLLKVARRGLPRGGRRTVPLPEIEVTDPPADEEAYQQVLRSAIARLPESMQIVLNLKYHEGLTAAEIGRRRSRGDTNSWRSRSLCLSRSP
jgi:RNA polymerase sigma factor (sigma-70 family)